MRRERLRGEVAWYTVGGRYVHLRCTAQRTIFGHIPRVRWVVTVEADIPGLGPQFVRRKVSRDEARDVLAAMRRATYVLSDEARAARRPPPPGSTLHGRVEHLGEPRLLGAMPIGRGGDDG